MGSKKFSSFKDTINNTMISKVVMIHLWQKDLRAPFGPSSHVHYGGGESLILSGNWETFQTYVLSASCSTWPDGNFKIL